MPEAQIHHIKSTLESVRMKVDTAIPLARLDGYEAVRFTSIEVNKWLRKRPDNTIKKLAKKSGLNVQTVSRLVCRETKSPHITTIIRLLSSIGFSAVKFQRD